MASRTTLRYPEGTKEVGTARVREDLTVGRSFAEREIHRRTGVQPTSEFDDIAVGPPVKSLAPTAPARPKAPAKPRASKYGNTPCESGGIKFDSKREMMRWHDLVQMQVRGEISELEMQVPFVLVPACVINGRKKPALRYIADFVYFKRGEETQTIEDVKGQLTQVYKIKRHLMAARGLTIVEVK